MIKYEIPVDRVSVKSDAGLCFVYFSVVTRGCQLLSWRVINTIYALRFIIYLYGIIEDFTQCYSYRFACKRIYYFIHSHIWIRAQSVYIKIYFHCCASIFFSIHYSLTWSEVLCKRRFFNFFFLRINDNVSMPRWQNVPRWELFWHATSWYFFLLLIVA